MELIGDVSALATLILFAIYWVGRIWTVKIDSKYPKVDIKIDFERSIEDYDNFDIECEGNEVVLISVPENLKYLKVVSVTWTKENGFIVGEEQGKVEFIPAGKRIVLRTLVPEGLPNQMIKFEYSTGVRGSFILSYDGRSNGEGVSAMNLVLENTPMSWLYALLR